MIAFDLRACDYSGQKRIEYDGTQYRIVRVYAGWRNAGAELFRV